MGHLELNGFLANAYHVMEHGQDKAIYKDFEKVCPALSFIGTSR